MKQPVIPIKIGVNMDNDSICDFASQLKNWHAIFGFFVRLHMLLSNATCVMIFEQTGQQCEQTNYTVCISFQLLLVFKMHPK